MLISAKDFKNFKLRAKDGEDIGHAREFYFDDKYWTVRYLVADTGGWLTGRAVLISPYALEPVNAVERVLPVSLTKKQIEDSPSLETHEPVSRQFETHYYDYYGWPNYGFGSYAWGAYPYLLRDQPYERSVDGVQDWDPHLRSTRAVTGYNIQALDGEIGHVEDFVIDAETWSIRYLVVDTKNWWPGKRVLISPQWIERVSWVELMVYLSLSRERIKQAPEYRPEFLNRDYETSLYHHYEQPEYWNDETITPAGIQSSHKFTTEKKESPMSTQKAYTIVVGVDYSELGDLALERAFDQAKAHERAQVHVIHVEATAAPDADGIKNDASSAAPNTASLRLHDQVEQVVKRWCDTHLSPAPFDRLTTHLRSDDAAEAIAQLASDVEADLVVVGTHGRRGARRFLLGSVAEGTVRLAPSAVLVVRPADASVPKIEPPCPQCLETRRATDGKEFWCERHRQHHNRAHTYHFSPVRGSHQSSLLYPMRGTHIEG